jgi:hypothetical protein
MWDVFICHASEDKEPFVRDLAEALRKFRCEVWYDEFTLHVGDSLSASVDQGLSRSRFGVVVLSQAFLGKPWPDYELRGLLAKDIHGGRVILPVWHGVSRAQVAQFSPSLADRFAISTAEASTMEVAIQLLEVIKPDAYTHVHRILAEHADRQSRPSFATPIARVRLGPKRHRDLPETLRLRIKLIHHTLFDVFPQPLRDALDDFCHDQHPDREVHIWECIATAYLHATFGQTLSLDQRREIFRVFLQLSSGDSEVTARYLSQAQMGRLRRVYQSVIPVVERDDPFPLPSSASEAAV